MIGFISFVTRDLIESEKAAVEDLANQQHLSINRQLSHMIYDLVGMAQTVALISDDVEEIMEYVESKKELLGFETAIFANIDGSGIEVTGERIDISEDDYFKISIAGETFATETYISDETGKQVITVSAPIVMENEIVGVLAIQYSRQYLNNLLKSLTDESGANLILNSEGDVIFSTSSYIPQTDIYKTVKFKEGENFKGMVESFKDQQSGSVFYSLNDQDFFGEYRPIVINDWILMFEVSAENVYQRANNIAITMGGISFALLFLAATIVIYIVTTKNKYAKRLEKIAFYDELTSSPNIEKLKLHMEDFLKNKPCDSYGIVKFDVANFKAINEIHGFDVGDKVLCAIAGVGSSVQGKHFMQARTGPDEFMFFAKDEQIYDLDQRKEGFEKLFKSLIPELIDHNFFFRYGRYYIKNGEQNVNDIISRVNIAHSTAKAIATKEVCDYDEKYTQKVLKDAEITNKMHKALGNDEFKMYLQPKVDIATERVTSAEALVRWHDPEKGVVFPNDFIPLFEQNGFILELDKYMLHLICHLIGEWKTKGIEIIPVSVNFSRLHLHNLNFVEEVVEIVNSYNVEHKYIEIEITETIVSENENDFKKIVKQLQHAGFLVSIDDFGSGYSSLGMLKNFDVDTVKLDRSFFVEVDDEREHQKANLVVGSIVDLSKNLGMHTVAEGIETENQIEFLKKINCNAAQGYFYSKPLPVAEFEKFCVEQNQK